MDDSDALECLGVLADVWAASELATGSDVLNIIDPTLLFALLAG